MRRRAKSQSFVCEIGQRLYRVRINTFADAEALHRQVSARNRLLRRPARKNPKRRRNPGFRRKHFSRTRDIPEDLLRILETKKPDYDGDEQTGWSFKWDGSFWKATSCAIPANGDRCDLTLEESA